MAFGLTVLASGSSGNAALLEADGMDVLIDAGLGPRQLAVRMATVGVSWPRIRAVVLTHTHGDHWNDRVFAQLLRMRIAVWCHEEHLDALRRHSKSFAAMHRAKLFHVYEANAAFRLSSFVWCQPLAVPHDSGATFGFRFDGRANLFHPRWSLAYVADLGTWDDALADSLSDVDLLALEFNHDVALQRSSGRSAWLIDRVLGDQGHLSNEQAAALLSDVVRRSTPGRLRRLVQLHLSRQCNRPQLASSAAREALRSGADVEVEIHTAEQAVASPRFLAGAGV
jgi:phosphoribosyl 1,2-cyclic phosphodiesterase